MIFRFGVFFVRTFREKISISGLLSFKFIVILSHKYVRQMRLNLLVLKGH